EVALVLAIVVVNDDHELAAGERFDHGVDAMMGFKHGAVHFSPGEARTATSDRRLPARVDADSDRRPRTPPSPRRSAPRGCRHTGRAGPWSRSRSRARSGRRCGAG